MRYLLTTAVLAGLLSGLAGAGEEELIWQDGKWVRQPPPQEGSPAGEAAIVRRDLDQKKFADAVSHAERFAKRYPNDPLLEEVLGLAGDAELAREHYWQAYNKYEDQLKQFPNGDRMERAFQREMEVAQAFLAGKKKTVGKIFKLPAQEDGIEILEKIADRAPGTPRAELALLAIADYHFDKAEWKDAADRYDAYLKLFPKSQRAPHAELRAAQSYRRAYRGPAYDETPLLEAQQRFKTFLENYPDKAREAQVEDILAAIRPDRAQRIFETARFYTRTDHPEAAAQYYRQVAKEYPDTEWGRKAQQILGEPPGTAPAPEAGVPPVAPATGPARAPATGDSAATRPAAAKKEDKP